MRRAGTPGRSAKIGAMGRRFAIGFALAALVLAVAPAGGQDGRGLTDQKRAVDDKIASLQDKIRHATQREGVLTTEISAVSTKIHGLEDDVAGATSKLEQLRKVLILHQRKLNRLNALYTVQTRKLLFLQQQYRESVARLNRRVIQIYTSNPPDAVSVVLAASSIGELVDQVEFSNAIGRQDELIAARVKHAKLEMQETRNKTRKVRAGVRVVTGQIATRTSEQLQVRNSLVATQQELAAARRLKESALSSVRESKDEYLQEASALLAQSAAIAARSRAAQSGGATGSGAVPTGGLGWPVSGPVTSGFGERWGRMHEGIDIGVPTGTPVAAAAAGTVIVAGWMGGYGNLVVIDHGNGLATAYGHNSVLSVSVGQVVSRGQTIALAGNTGRSFGSHVHFEVRVNGNAVNPLAYL